MDDPREDTLEFIFDAAPAPSEEARFFVEEPGKAPRVVRVSPGCPLLIGRGPAQDVGLDDPSVSRAHAELTFEANGVVVRDLGSSNGTWLGTARITGVAKVPPGVVLRFGNTRLVPVAPETSASADALGVTPLEPRPALDAGRRLLTERINLLSGEIDVAQTTADPLLVVAPLPLVAPLARGALTRWLAVVGAVLAGVITGTLDGLVASRDGLHGVDVALSIGHCIAANTAGAMIVGWVTQPVLTAAERIVPLQLLWRWVRRGPKAWFARDPGLALRVALMFLGAVSAVGPVFPASHFVVNHLHSRTLMAMLITVVCALSIPFSALVVTLAAGPVSALLRRLSNIASAGAVMLVALSALALGATLFWQFKTEWITSLHWETVTVFAVFPLVYAVSLATLGVGRERAAKPFSKRVAFLTCALVLVALIASGFTLGSQQTVASAVLTRSATAGLVARTLRGTLDADDDGASPIFNGGDCNDDDPSINPSAFDVPNNGVDENCTGADALAWRGESDGAFVTDTGLAPNVRPSFLLLTIDTLRPDHMSAYGYERPTTPNIDAFARDAVRFTNARTSAPRTIAAFSSVWTGRYPSRVAWGPDGSHPTLLDRNVTLAELLRDRGYRTASFTDTNYFDEAPGMLQGFTDQVAGESFKSDGARAIDAAITWMTERSIEGADIFAWVHLLEPHWPYRDRSSPRDFGHGTIDAYDEEIALADSLMARMIAAADTWNAHHPERPLVVIVTADHGEGLGAHGVRTHGLDQHEEAMRIPLMMSAPGIEVGTRSDLVSLVDVPATILNYAGVRPATALSGRSLVGMLRDRSWPGRGTPWRNEIFAELTTSTDQRDTPRVLYSLPYKLTWDFRSGTWALFDLVRDPHETQNLFDERTDVASRMRERINAWAVGAPAYASIR